MPNQMDADHQRNEKKNTKMNTKFIGVFVFVSVDARASVFVLNVQSLDHACIIYLARYKVKTIMSIVACDSHSFYKKNKI